VYQNFMSYSSGVYNKIEGDLLGGHAVMIFGWGTENGTPYWLVRNSWGASWPTGAAPNDAGNFKILRGKDLCGFEADVYAGLADA
jgi:cathepsin B